MKQAKNGKRRRSGSLVAEFPAVLWMMFFLFVFPLVDLATIGLRAFAFVNAANQSVHQAIHCQTFQAPLLIGATTYPSAKQTAVATADQVIQAWSGIRLLTPLDLRIIQKPLPGVVPVPPAVPDSSVPLAQVPDQNSYIVSLRVTMVGEVDPLVTFNIPFLGNNIPGLSAPIPISTHSEAVFENLSGLVN